MIDYKKRTLDLAVIGNCSTAALIDSTGDINWSCWPSFEDNPLFCSLVNQDEVGDAKTGFWRIEIQDYSHSKQFYHDNTAILETQLYSHYGSALRIIDFMPRFKHYNRKFREQIIIRIIEPLEGTPMASMKIRPMHNYGETPFKASLSSNHILYQAGDEEYRLTSSAPLSKINREQQFLVNQRYSFFFSVNESLKEDVDLYCDDLLNRTTSYWQDFVRHLHIPPEWQDEVIRATITLKLCTYEETGAALAALTTSIPEADKSVRTWDYRYCWLRDSYYTISALNRVNITDTMEDYLNFILHIAEGYDGGDIQPLFGIHHDTIIEEFEAKHLSGFKGNKPVRVGNAAYSQIQNDSYGSIIMALTQLFFDRRLSQKVGIKEFKQFEKFGTRAFEVWNKPDAGIWEFRGSTDIRTYSAISCWVALDRLSLIAEKLDLFERARYWRDKADEVREETLKRAWNNDKGHFTESFEGDHLDASLLLMHEFGFIDPTDERFVKTVHAIGKDLLKNDLLYRYMNEDDFGFPETSFTICTFWYIAAMHAIGEEAEARRLFVNILSKRNHAGLLSEDIDFNTDELWGNFPQTYSMVGIIQCAHRLSKKWREVLRG